MDTKDRLIEKQKQLIELLDLFALLPRSESIDKNVLESEISELKKKLNQPELCPICKTTYLSDRVCLTCTKELCLPVQK